MLQTLYLQVARNLHTCSTSTGLNVVSSSLRSQPSPSPVVPFFARPSNWDCTRSWFHNGVLVSAV